MHSRSSNRVLSRFNEVNTIKNFETIKENENFITVNGNNYLEIMKSIQEIIIEYLRNEVQKEEELFSTLIKFEDISNDIQILKEMLHLLSAISTNHYRNHQFFNKIEKILNYYKDPIQDLPNQQLFEIFKKSKRILLFLFKKQFLIPDSYIFNKISKSKYNNYLSYFYPEFKSFMTLQNQKEIKQNLPDDEIYEQYRQEGENENDICKLIRNDSIKEFVIYVTQNPNSLLSTIQPSIYETNSCLINKNLNLLEYTVFYGSIQIFQYLVKKDINFSSDQNLLTYAVHGKNEDIIHILEEKIKNTNTNSFDARKRNQNNKKMLYQNLYKESIKCHHNKIAKYFYNNFIQASENNEKIEDFILIYYETYNYQFIPHDLIITDLRFLCKYDYLYYIYYYINQNLKYVLNTLFPRTNRSNCYNKNKISCLIYSIKKGNCELAQLLLNINDIDPNISYSHNGITTPLLILAIENKNCKIIDILLASQKINPNINKVINEDNKSIIEKTALQIAFETNNQIIFDKLLINDKIDVNNKIKNKIISEQLIKIESKTILHFAIEKKNKEIYSKLLTIRNDLNINQPQTIELLYQNKKFLIETKTPLYIAINSNCNEIVNDLISNEKIDINSEIKICNFDESNNIIIIEKNIFHLAVEQGNLDLIEKLISTGTVDINKNKITIFFSYVNNKNYTLSSSPPLHIAINQNNYNVVQKLLEYKECDINSKSYKYDEKNFLKVNKSSLFLAFEKGSIDVIKHLLQNESINVNEKIFYYNNSYKVIRVTSPFYKALSNKNPEQVRLLLERSDLQINEKYKFKKLNIETVKMSPLFYAVKMKNIEIIKMLVEADNEIDVNAKSKIKTKSASLNQKIVEKLTALQYAIKNNDIDIVKLLLNQSKIDVNTVTITEKSVYAKPINEKAITKKLAINSNRDCNHVWGKFYANTSEIDANKKNESKQKSNIIIENERIEKNALSIAIENKNEDIVSLLYKHKKINIDKVLNIKKSKDDHSEKIIKSSEELQTSHKNNPRAPVFKNKNTIQASQNSPTIFISNTKNPQNLQGNQSQQENPPLLMDSAILKERPDVKLCDVSGLSSAKKTLEEAVILPIMFPSLFQGPTRPWKGILLYGPPGTGKSFLAKAIAGEANNFAFLTVSPSDLISKFFGESEKLIKSLFETARQNRPSVIFIDEIDSIVSARGSTNEHECSRRVKTEFFTQMDGVSSNNDGVVVIAATNLPWLLDPAIIRRFEKRIYVPLPDFESRKSLFHNKLKGSHHSLTNREIDELATKAEGLSGADIGILVRDALMQPIRELQESNFFTMKIGVDMNGEKRDGLWAACSQFTPGARQCTWKDLPPSDVMRPVADISYFKKSAANIKPSVSKSDLPQYENWTKQYGENGV